MAPAATFLWSPEQDLVLNLGWERGAGFLVSSTCHRPISASSHQAHIFSTIALPPDSWSLVIKTMTFHISSFPQEWGLLCQPLLQTTKAGRPRDNSFLFFFSIWMIWTGNFSETACTSYLSPYTEQWALMIFPPWWHRVVTANISNVLDVQCTWRLPQVEWH